MDEVVREQRRLGIAATDAAPISGLSPFKSAADVWVEKKYPELMPPDEPVPELYWGTKHEPMIVDEYAKITGQELKPIGLVRNKKIQWIMCQPDRQVGNKPKGLEAKTAGGYNTHEWGPAGTDLVPMYHMIQVQHSMMCTGWREWDLAVLIGGNDFRIYHLWWNHELIKELFEIEREFYTDFVAGKKTPPLDWGKNVANFANAKWPRHKPDTVLDVDKNGDRSLEEALTMLSRVRAAQKSAEQEEEKQQTLIKSYMRDRERLQWAGGGISILWRQAKDSKKIDRETLIEALLPHVSLPPEKIEALIKEHTETKPGVRAFRVYDDKRSE